MAELQAYLYDIEIFADLEGKSASDSPPATIPPGSYTTMFPYLPDIAMMQNWELSRCWSSLTWLILTLTFLLHVNEKNGNYPATNC